MISDESRARLLNGYANAAKRHAETKHLPPVYRAEVLDALIGDLFSAMGPAVDELRNGLRAEAMRRLTAARAHHADTGRNTY